jgi:hypothetical protein
MFGIVTLKRQFAETAEDIRAAREEREEAEQREALYHERAVKTAIARHPELSAADFAMGRGGVDHDTVCALAFVEQDRVDRAEARQRAAELAERRASQPIPGGRTHAEVLDAASRWMDWVDSGGGL